MKLFFAAPIIVAALFALSAAPAATRDTRLFQICGLLRAYTPATETAAGSVAIGTRALSVAPSTKLENGGVSVAMGRELCLHGAIDARTGQVVGFLAFAFPSNRVICGTFADFGVGGPHRIAQLRAEFGTMTLTLDRSVPLEGLNRGEPVCFTLTIDARGDAVAVAWTSGPPRTVTACGVVTAYIPARAESPGRIAVGTRVYTIAAGTTYTGDPFGDRIDRTGVGQRMCLSGTLSSKELVAYVTFAMPSRMSGTAADYTPPTTSSSGLVVLGSSNLALRVPAGASFPDLSRGWHCFSLGLDKNGDAVIAAISECEPGRAAAAPPQLPATSTVDAAPLAYAGALIAATGLLLLVRSGGHRGRDRADSAGPTQRG